MINLLFRIINRRMKEQGIEDGMEEIIRYEEFSSDTVSALRIPMHAVKIEKTIPCFFHHSMVHAAYHISFKDIPGILKHFLVNIRFFKKQRQQQPTSCTLYVIPKKLFTSSPFYPKICISPTIPCLETAHEGQILHTILILSQKGPGCPEHTQQIGI